VRTGQNQRFQDENRRVSAEERSIVPEEIPLKQGGCLALRECFLAQNLVLLHMLNAHENIFFRCAPQKSLFFAQARRNIFESFRRRFRTILTLFAPACPAVRL